MAAEDVMDDVDQARARRKAAIAEAFEAVRTGPRIRITPDIDVPLVLLGRLEVAPD